MTRVLALDGGGTHTRCAVADLRGRVLGVGIAGPCNPRFVPADEARQAIVAAICSALESAGAGSRDVVAAYVGATAPESLVRSATEHVLPETRSVLGSEAEVCLASGTDDDFGAVVLAGTAPVLHSGSLVEALLVHATARDRLGDTRGAEAAIVPIGVGGFCAEKAMSTRNDDPQRASRPFDAARDGRPFSSRGLRIVDWNGDGRPDLVAVWEGPRPAPSPDNGPSGWRTG